MYLLHDGHTFWDVLVGDSLDRIAVAILGGLDSSLLEHCQKWSTEANICLSVFAYEAQ